MTEEERIDSLREKIFELYKIKPGRVTENQKVILSNDTNLSVSLIKKFLRQKKYDFSSDTLHRIAGITQGLKYNTVDGPDVFKFFKEIISQKDSKTGETKTVEKTIIFPYFDHWTPNLATGKIAPKSTGKSTGSIQFKKLESHYTKNTFYIPVLYHRKLKNYDKMWNGTQRNSHPSNLLDQSILSMHNNLLVLGDSGYGKTTFAHWICGLWKMNQIATSPVLLYIDLKADFFKVQSDLASYMYQQYNIEMDLQEVPDKGSYYLMLDGFEVLAAPIKSSILEQLKALSDAYKWMILC